jgi:hypothetical protein
VSAIATPMLRSRAEMAQEWAATEQYLLTGRPSRVRLVNLGSSLAMQRPFVICAAT